MKEYKQYEKYNGIHITNAKLFNDFYFNVCGGNESVVNKKLKLKMLWMLIPILGPVCYLQSYDDVGLLIL